MLEGADCTTVKVGGSRLGALERSGAPGRIRTHDPQIRSLVLYPAELPVLKAKAACARGRRRRSTAH